MAAFQDLKITGPSVDIAEPEISLFICKDQKKLTEGEKKAKTIEESFKNPFQAFLPAKPAQVASKKSSDAINDQWRKKSEEVIKEKSEKARKLDENIMEREVDDNAMKRKGDNTEEDEVVLRQPKIKKKKEKKCKEVKISKEDKSVDKTVFVPYDYSSASLNFSGQTSEQNKMFNPYNKLTEKSKQFSSKVRKKSGQRSMTFGNAKKP